jgi:hypothetical protein
VQVVLYAYLNCLLLYTYTMNHNHDICFQDTTFSYYWNQARNAAEHALAKRLVKNTMKTYLNTLRNSPRNIRAEAIPRSIWQAYYMSIPKKPLEEILGIVVALKKKFADMIENERENKNSVSFNFKAGSETYIIVADSDSCVIASVVPKPATVPAKGISCPYLQEFQEGYAMHRQGLAG